MFSNPPRHVAELFRDVLQEPIAQAFKVIIFAIIEDHNSGKEHNPQGNFKPFLRTRSGAGRATWACALVLTAPVGACRGVWHGGVRCAGRVRRIRAVDSVSGRPG